MSDVIVSTTESTTDVTTTNDVTTVAITDTTVEVSQATAGFQGVPGSNSDPTYVFVRNSTGALLPKGSIVYVSGANGVHTQVSLALATGDVTSARTLGWLAEDIANNASGLCCVEGYLDGVDTQGITEGAQLYLSPTVPGGFQETKPSAPDHMVYVGIAAKASAGNGRVFVHIQNGAELEELHDVKIVSPQNNDLLRYVSGTALWENVASTAITAGSAITAGTAYYASLSGTATTISGSITKSQVSDFTSGTVTSASTAQQAGTAVYALTSGTADYATTSGTSVYSANSGTAVTITGSITKSQVSDFTSGTVASASTALTAGTASFASQAGTAVYSDTSGTAVTISGTITNSQVSDFASGTVANISGTVTQAQVSGLGSALAGKAGLADNNTFTGTNTFSNFTTFQAASDAIPVRIFGANGQSADLFSVNDYLTNTQFEILSDGRAQSLKGIIATVSGTASIPLVVRGTAGQSANLTEWTNPAGSTVIARVDKNGAVSANYFGPSGAGLLGYLDWTTSSPLFQTGGTAVVGIRVRGASGQSADLISGQNSGGTTIFSVAASGALFTNSTLFTTAQTYVYGAGDYSAALNVQTRGTANPGVVVRGRASQTGNLQEWQTSTGGTGSIINPSGGFQFGTDLTSNGSFLSALNGRARFAISDASQIALTVRGASGQTANLLELQNSGSTAVATVSAAGALFVNNQTTGADSITIQRAGSTHFRVDPFNNAFAVGTLTIGQNTTPGSIQLGVFSGGTAVKGLVVRGAASQSANLQEWQTSSGSTAAFVDANGMASFLRGNFRGAVYGSGTYFGAVNVLQESGGHGIVIQGRDSQTTDLLRIRLGATPGANNDALLVQNNLGSTIAKIDSVGDVTARVFRSTLAARIATSDTTIAPMVISTIAGQTSNNTEFQSNAGTVALVSATGQITAGGTAKLGQVTVLPASTATVGIVVQGLLNQSADLQQWQTSTGSTAAYLGSGGAFRAAVLQTSSAAVDARLRNAGGEITFAKATAVSVNPGANYGKIYFRDGTNAGTLKLVVIAGTAGAETTILDNIPQS